MLETYRPGYALDQRSYLDPEVYRAEFELIWQRSWLFAAVGGELREPGDYVVYDVGDQSVLIVRLPDGGVAAHHNVCRHRGSLVATEASGRVRSFVCPYHQWVYDLDGSLRACRSMPKETDRSVLGLRPVQVRELEGLIYICLADDPPDFEPAARLMGPMAAVQGFGAAKVAASVDYEIAANWKLVWENNRECYHCDVNHPQYIKANFDRYDAIDMNERIELRMAEAAERCGLEVTHAEAGLAEFPDATGQIWYSANRTPMVEGYVSESMDGTRVAPLMGGYTSEDVGVLRLRTLPNFWQHGSCDHSVITRLTPAGFGVTRVRVTWLVDGDADDYRLEDLMPFWQLTSEQDWEICERQQRGVRSSAYLPGPLSPDKEYNVINFHRWWAGLVGQSTTLRRSSGLPA
ncbi:aromatic ring-hydroxylating dioxygenase subunit alpha [Nonomuraea sp. NPDC050556]|uniref:aromatic ring-hydroxylating dioxygenase subunit alpha n=1 Tax=Nonomuraea sp. NPDC050556 TaxID=3364369 RepID=UPI00378D4F45